MENKNLLDFDQHKILKYFPIKAAIMNPFIFGLLWQPECYV